jgi:DNA invertase Pin-like site-specific DNA recombinase
MKRKVIGYLRVSTIDQNNDKFESDILRFANNHEFGKVEFISEKISGMTSWKNRKLCQVVQSMKVGDIIIVPELSRIGRSTLDILEVLKTLSDRGVKVFSVKENFQLNGSDIQSKMMRTLLSLFSEIERDLISQRTKEGLANARSQGKLLGRPTGVGKSKLDQFRPEIVSLLQNGSTKKFVANRYKTTSPNLINWLKQNEIQITATP